LNNLAEGKKAIDEIHGSELAEILQ